MPLVYGAYTACLHDRSLPEALEVLASVGLTGAEVNAGGFIPSPHCPVDALLASSRARREYLQTFADAGMQLTGLNTSGNPLSPLPGVGPQQAEDLRRAIRAAGALGVGEVVAMSGTPGSDAGAAYPTWVVNPWNGVDLDVLDYQWSVAVPFWRQIDAIARAEGVQVCLELHPHNLVFSPLTFGQLLERAETTNIAVNMDPSHLFWQQMEPLACIAALGDHVKHVHAKDTAVLPEVAVRGVLDSTFSRLPEGTADPVPTGIGHTVAQWPSEPAWRFVALGEGHDVDYWARFLTALAAVDPDMHVNIEHEDAAFESLEGLARGARTLLEAAGRAGV